MMSKKLRARKLLVALVVPWLCFAGIMMAVGSPFVDEGDSPGRMVLENLVWYVLFTLPLAPIGMLVAAAFWDAANRMMIWADFAPEPRQESFPENGPPSALVPTVQALLFAAGIAGSFLAIGMLSTYQFALVQ